MLCAGRRGDGSRVPGRRLLHVVLLAASLLLIVAPAAARGHAAAGPGSRAILAAPEPGLGAGDPVVVDADGDCLRLRESPGFGGRILGCLDEGTTLTALYGAETRDGLLWREVWGGGLHGWAAELHLQPAPPSLGCGGSSAIPVGISGPDSLQAGLSLFVWGGGTVQGIYDAASERGCNPQTVWATAPDQRMVGYVFGAPAFVNRAWFDLFPGGRIGAPRALILRCADAAVGITDASRVSATREPVPLGSTVAPEISAEAAIVVDGASGAVLFEEDARRPLPPASLTKIATAIVAIEGTDLDAWAVSNVDASAMHDSSVMGLRVGDCFTVRDLLYGLLLPSGNDAALALARYIAGDDEAFVDRMHTMLARLGLAETGFIDPHGLGGDGHESSAYDLAMLTRYAMEIPEFREIVSARSQTVHGTRTLFLPTGNHFLDRYGGADGVKTGFTEEAGYTFVASATREGRQLLAVVLNSPDPSTRFTDAEQLLDWAFTSFDFP